MKHPRSAAEQRARYSESHTSTQGDSVADKQRTVLFALLEHGRPSASLQRAAEVARAMNAKLHVMRVLPNVVHLDPFERSLNIIGTFMSVERTLSALRTTEAWINAHPSVSENSCSVEIASGDFVEEVAVRSSELDAFLIVLPPREGRIDSAVTSLARMARTNVLVAHSRKLGNSIIAATDLQDANYPVLRAAAIFGELFRESVIAMHNAGERPPGRVLDEPTADSDADGVAGRRDAFWDLASNHGRIDAEFVVTHEDDVAAAVLHQARAVAADLVVVGSHPRTWIDRLLGSGVANTVVACTERSVLVTPLGLAD